MTASSPPPAFLHDLNLDQVIDAIVADRETYSLATYFHRPLQTAEDISYRQAIFRSLEADEPRHLIERFGEGMVRTRALLNVAGKGHDRYGKQRWFLNAVDQYCRTVLLLLAEMQRADLRAGGLGDLRRYLEQLVDADEFRGLHREAQELLSALGKVRYDVFIRGARLTVGSFDDESDYSEIVRATFERFAQGEVKDYRTQPPDSAWLNHVEGALLEFVARLHPALFDALTRFCGERADFLDGTLVQVDRELQFYLAYLAYLEPLRSVGLKVCYPTFAGADRTVHATKTYDIALAEQMSRTASTVVVNDFQLNGAERLLVVSGPNQGGKTTLARTFGQVHYLATLGCPVPGTEARLVIPDRIFTHFEREEDLDSLAGKLEDELRRVHDILESATERSVVILNEMFSSTTVKDAEALSRVVLARVLNLDCVGVCVTFIDGLSRIDERTVSMVSTVRADDPAVRTFMLVRRRADGKAFALAIANKYGLTYDRLRERVTS